MILDEHRLYCAVTSNVIAKDASIYESHELSGVGVSKIGQKTQLAEILEVTSQLRGKIENFANDTVCEVDLYKLALKIWMLSLRLLPFCAAIKH